MVTTLTIKRDYFPLKEVIYYPTGDMQTSFFLFIFDISGGAFEPGDTNSQGLSFESMPLWKEKKNTLIA